jgi:hypothetical protein
VLAWLVFMYYRFVDGWLTSLSALGQGLAAMTVIVTVALVVGGVLLWRRRHRSRRLPSVDLADAAVAVIIHDPSNINTESPAIERPLSSTGQPTRPPGRVSPSPSPSQFGSSPSLSLDVSFDSVMLSDDGSDHSWQLSDDSSSSVSYPANSGRIHVSRSSSAVANSRAPLSRASGDSDSSFVSLQLQDPESSHDTAASSPNDDSDFGSFSSSGSVDSD